MCLDMVKGWKRRKGSEVCGGGRGNTYLDPAFHRRVTELLIHSVPLHETCEVGRQCGCVGV
jgi:hypothetical protein